jgi:hypothetical protein
VFFKPGQAPDKVIQSFEVFFPTVKDITGYKEKIYLFFDAKVDD